MTLAFDKTYVVGFMFNPDRDKVLLIQKLGPKWQNGKYNGVGGKIELGEEPIDAMIREFEEEAGILTSPDDWEKIVIYTSYEDSPYQVHFFRAFAIRIYEAYSKTDELVSRFDIANLPKNVIHILNWIIPLCLDEQVATNPPILVFEQILKNNDSTK